MLDYEKNFPQYRLIAGVDEAGRGPLAGPVAVGAVILPSDDPIEGVDDSKKLSEKTRERLYDLIVEKAIAWRVELVDERTIDRINILQATKLGMARAIAGLAVRPEIVLIDAVKDVDTPLLQVAIVKGDALSYNIAAASILAKVTRDRLMREYDKQYPLYGFARNKGYGSAAHIAALKANGPCPIHRRTFIGHFCHADVETDRR